MVNNSWDILNDILGHKYHQNHPNSEFYYIYVFCFQILTLIISLTFNLDLLSSNHARLLSAGIGKTIDRVLRSHPSQTSSKVTFIANAVFLS